MTLAEFAGENDSPLAAAVVGHQAWRNDPSYLKVLQGTTLRIANKGGRPHTFTKVAAFGGGTAPNPALNEGLITSPECPASVDHRRRRQQRAVRARSRQPPLHRVASTRGCGR